MRFRTSCCRVSVVIGAVLVVNVVFMWSSVPGPAVKCNCRCVNNCHNATTVSHSSSHATSSAIITGFERSSTKPAVTQSLTESEQWNPHQLAVVVPFRNRHDEMMEFVPHIHSFLSRQRVRHQIWVINQADKHRFNRAMLLNIGFLLTRHDCDYMVMHDVDLLPLNNDLQYAYPTDGPLHISSPQLHPLYHYRTFVGGILIMSREQFERVNGLSTLFWGWGREDDELYMRMMEAGMKVHYPQGITTGYKTFRHLHDRKERPRDMKRYGQQWQISRERDRETGLLTTKYDIVKIVNMTIQGAPVHFVSVNLNCDYSKTPYCDHQ